MSRLHKQPEKDYTLVWDSIKVTIIVTMVAVAGLMFGAGIENIISVVTQLKPTDPIMNDYPFIVWVCFIPGLYIFSFVALNCLNYQCENGIFTLPYKKDNPYY